MKNIMLVVGLLVVTLSSVLSQEFLSRQPRPDELQRVSGVDWPLKFGSPHAVLYKPGEAEAYTIVLGGSNHHVIFGSTSTSNVLVHLPNCTNAVGARFRFVSGANTHVHLTNANGNTFTDVTNYFTGASNAVASWRMQSNTVAEVFTPSGTNWLVIPVH